VETSYKAIWDKTVSSTTSLLPHFFTGVIGVHGSQSSYSGYLIMTIVLPIHRDY